VESAIDDPEVMSGKIVCDGKFCPAGHNLPECLDMYFKFFWVFDLEYPVGLKIFFQFLEVVIYKMPMVKGKKSIPTSITEVAALFGIS